MSDVLYYYNRISCYSVVRPSWMTHTSVTMDFYRNFIKMVGWHISWVCGYVCQICPMPVPSNVFVFYNINGLRSGGRYLPVALHREILRLLKL